MQRAVPSRNPLVGDWLRESVAHRLGLPPGEPLPPVVKVEQAAKILGVARGTAYEATETGDLPVIRQGRRKLVPTQKLLELLGESSQAPAGPPSSRPGPLLPEGVE